MKPTTIALLFTGIFMLMSYSVAKKKPGKLQKIPAQAVDLFQLLGDSASGEKNNVPAFEISKQVTFREYKEYLKAVKKDSSESFYRSQLPDTTIAKRVDWEKYISDEIYNDYPVLGISWENAMNYCKWRTLKENKNGNYLQFIYRLPSCSEWLAAKYYLETNQLESDFSKNYSDWLLSTKDESLFDFRGSGSARKWPYDYTYFHKAKDPIVMKRKLVIGDSYRYQLENQAGSFFSYYATEGYRQVAFRMVKDYVSRDEDDEIKLNTNASKIIDYWKLETE
ncbi:MAG TPA: SUMF1/EgtB/PvdO family nonheme iron enzyme [Fluviicola sp.]|nr:SUMF1/EgtB/PvdO family nonheme iron enzyme [Fluviicola sp.]